MANKYLFIIWNKALWCKKRITNDLSNSFIIEKDIYIKWSKKNFTKNLTSLYGRKIGLAQEKIDFCGNGIFNLLIVSDPNPKFEYRNMYDGKEEVNSSIYDKKMLYRKWTAGCHRIHCSDTYEETIHDLTVLFGTDYANIVDSYTNGNTISLDTKSILGFESNKDIIDSLKLVTKFNYREVNNDLYIFTSYRFDVESFLNLNKVEKNHFVSKNSNVYIFGEAEGDVTSSMVNKLISLPQNDFLNDIELIIDYLNGESDSKNISYLLIKYNLLNMPEKKDIIRKVKKPSYRNRMVKELKLLYARLKYALKK